MRELADVLITFEKPWHTEEIPEEWKKANVTPVFEKGKKGDLRNHRPVNLTSVTGNVMEQLILETMLNIQKTRR